VPPDITIQWALAPTLFPNKKASPLEDAVQSLAFFAFDDHQLSRRWIGEMPDMGYKWVLVLVQHLVG
jgi:hypothetical protein